MVEDRLLIWKFKLGSQEALQRIYEKYKNDLLKLAIALVNDTNTAEDIVQDVFVSFAQSAARIRLAGNLKTYLATCVANRTRNAVRDRQRHETSGLDDSDGMIRAMAQVPYEQREVIGLYMQGGMTFRQIAKMQNASINTIQGRYRYGMDKLRSLLNGKIEK
jgi:RNA polymerase sigma-70 factor (ECF subfamily)